MDWKSIAICHIKLTRTALGTEELNKSYKSIDALRAIDKDMSIMDLAVYLAWKFLAEIVIARSHMHCREKHNS